ncbi:uncharacterized protein LOC124282905 isoform X2 [Haliotis rubra]|uniref:uncharacterized protein LOC124282905 isoform X2 n=1 Tax=Haliotis rubra TaxID=36100 RepID=UPI001EE5E1C3|nr:uncharacterized protein LOC124282905 isoform X2 [Haliotis rubra]
MKCLVLLGLVLIIAEFTALACDCSGCPTGGVCVGPSGMSQKFCVCVDDKILGVRSIAKHLSKYLAGKKGHGSKPHLRQPLRVNRKKVKPTNLHRKKAKVARLHRKKGAKRV